jgi:uncharacterized protein YdhG (YjbR/CyaY superfamily)
MSTKPTVKTIDEYLAPLNQEKRSALEKLRKAIRAAAPEAEEYIGYGIPCFRMAGKLLVSFGAGKNHCAFYPGKHPIEAHRDELASYGVNNATIRFHPDHPLPAALVRTLVKTRIAERVR